MKLNPIIKFFAFLGMNKWRREHYKRALTVNDESVEYTQERLRQIALDNIRVAIYAANLAMTILILLMIILK